MAAGTHEVPVTMEEIPTYLRGGHITPRRERARRSTAAMHTDPITLVIPYPSLRRKPPLPVHIPSPLSMCTPLGMCAPRPQLHDMQTSASKL